MKRRELKFPDWSGTSKDLHLTYEDMGDSIYVEIVSGLDEDGNVCLLNVSLVPNLPMKDSQTTINFYKERFKESTRSAALGVKVINDVTTPLIKYSLTSHLLSRFASEDYPIKMDIYKDLDTLSYRYKMFTYWREDAPALCISVLSDEPVEKVRSRVKVARRRKLLPALGQGVRLP